MFPCILGHGFFCGMSVEVKTVAADCLNDDEPCLASSRL